MISKPEVDAAVGDLPCVLCDRIDSGDCEVFAMPEQARLVIVGAGIVGCSVAYHLARLGWRDMIVLDKGDLFENDGSTSHAPGGMFLTNSSRMMTEFAKYSRRFYAEFELD